MSPDTAPYRDTFLSHDERVDDLLNRMTLADKAGLLFHDMAEPGRNGELAGNDNSLGKPATEDAIRSLRMTHFNLVGPIVDVRAHVRWYNRMQHIALDTPLGIPVTLASDPRHAFSSNPGTAALAGAFSQWPESLGFAALRDAELVQQFADIVRREYVATGIRTALHPQIDLATEPRWARSGATFGEDADLTSHLVASYIRGLQGSEFGAQSVSAVVKHFPGGGPQKDGEDPHFPYGREQVYPGGYFDYHLQPFIAAIAAGARQMMPYYGMPIGTPYEEVAFGFNKGIVTDLLRHQLGFEGIVLSDWGLLTDGVVMGQYLPARAWGVEHLTEHERALKALDAGIDQFGGETAPQLVIDLVEQGRLAEERLDRSVRRLLAEKFALGLFDDPFLDEDEALDTVGRADFSELGASTQRRAIVQLTAASARNPGATSSPTQRVYVEGIAESQAKRMGELAPTPELADVAVLRLTAPFEARPGGFESFFHAGALEFTPDELGRILSLCRAVPTTVVLYLDRPAAIPELAEAAASLFVEFGATDEAVVDIMMGVARAKGRLPFDLPRSTAAAAASYPDAPFHTENPVFRFGDGVI